MKEIWANQEKITLLDDFGFAQTDEDFAQSWRTFGLPKEVPRPLAASPGAHICIGVAL